MTIEKIYQASLKKMGAETNSQLNIGAFKMHLYLWRFLFAVLSFLLYVPTIIEFYSGAGTGLIFHVRNGFIVVVAIAIEIGLSFSLKTYFEKVFLPNAKKLRKPKPFAVILLALVSIFGSSFSGVNTVQLVSDVETQKIKTEITREQKQLIEPYRLQIDRNNLKIDQNDQLVKTNNELIKNLQKVSVTGHGSSQIKNYQQQNLMLQQQNNELLKLNKQLLKDIKSVEKDSKTESEKKLFSYSKKELIYVIIFSLGGIFTVLCLVYSYRFIAIYRRDIILEAAHIQELNKNVLTTFDQHKHNEPITTILQKKKNETKNPESLKNSSFDLAKLQKKGIDIKKAYIFIEIVNKFGESFTIKAIEDYGINALAREIVEKYPNGYKITQIKTEIKRITLTSAVKK